MLLHSVDQGRVLTGFLFPVNPQKKKGKEKRKKIFKDILI